MAVFGYFRRRRARESALPERALEEMRAEAAGQAGGPSPDDAAGPAEPDESDPPPPTELPGANAAELGELIRRAASTGLPQVTTDTHEVDRATGIPEEIREILGQGPDPPRHTRRLDPDELEALRERVRERLRSEGIDPDSGRPL